MTYTGRISSLILTALFVFATGVSHAQINNAYKDSMEYLDATEAIRNGFTPNVPGTFFEATSPDIPYVDRSRRNLDNTELNKIATLSAGCATVNLGEMMGAIVEDGLSEWQAFTNTDAFRDAANNIFTSPQLPEMYEAVDNYAYKRAKVYMDRCDALQVEDETMDIVWESVLTCVDAKLENDYTNQKLIAKSYFECLNDPIDEDGSIHTRFKEVAVSEKWSGTLYSSLIQTDFCEFSGDKSYKEACALLAFLPNIKWCPGGLIKNKDANGNPVKPYCNEYGNSNSEGAYSPELISPKEIFDIAFAMTEYIASYGYTMAAHFLTPATSPIKPAVFRTLVKYTENAHDTGYEHATEHVARRYEQKIDDTDAARLNLFTGIRPTNPGLPGYIDDDFVKSYGPYLKYTGCTSYGMGPRYDRDIESLEHAVGSIVTYDGFSDEEILAQTINTEAEYYDPNVMYPYLFTLVINNMPDIKDNKNIEFVSKGALNDSIASLAVKRFYDSGIVKQTYTGFTQPDRDNIILDTKKAVGLIGTAVACSSLHDLRLSLADYVAVHDQGGGSGPALLAYRTQLAHLATIKVMDYIKYRLELAQLQMSFSPPIRDVGYGSHIIKAINKLTNSFNQRIENLNAVRDVQKDFVRDYSR